MLFHGLEYGRAWNLYCFCLNVTINMRLETIKVWILRIYNSLLCDSKPTNSNIFSRFWDPDIFVRPRASIHSPPAHLCFPLHTHSIIKIKPILILSVKPNNFAPDFTFHARHIHHKMSTEADIETFFNAALNLTKQSGELIRTKIYSGVSVETKSCDIDLVTETDQEVEKLLITGLTTQFPDHKFIGEEAVSSGKKSDLTSSPTWVIDPIDGTLNFVHAFPHCCISIALFIDAAPVLGIIYNPMLEQLFTAKKGQGAFLNGKKINVSKIDSLSESLIMMENGTSRDAERTKALFENQQLIIPKVHGTRSLGSAALNMAMVACGAAESYFEFGIHIWDIGAGEIIVKEAGGVVIDPAGGELDRLSRRVLCASTQNVADSLSKILVQYYPSPRD